MDSYIGEIRLFAGDFASPDWAKCNGQLLKVDRYRPLYAVIRNIYGGTKDVDFNLPGLQSIVPIGAGQGAGLANNYPIGTPGGGPVTMTDLPEHNHPMYAINRPATITSPEGMMLANLNRKNKYSNKAPEKDSNLNLETIKDEPKTVTPVDNQQPYLTMGYFICVNGH